MLDFALDEDDSVSSNLHGPPWRLDVDSSMRFFRFLFGMKQDILPETDQTAMRLNVSIEDDML